MTDVYIQAKHGMPYSMNGVTAFFGFQELGYRIELFESIDLTELDPSTDTIVVGGVGTVHKALKKLKIEVPPALDYPTELEKYLGRTIFTTTMSAIVHDNQFPYFIKPVGQDLLFKGTMIQSVADFVRLSGIPETTSIYKSDPISFVSEYRCFILNRRVLACKHYWGNSLVFPDRQVVLDAVATYQSSPVAYSLDVGITEEGKTVLVEVNDAYSLGSYGLQPIAYSRFLEARWNEMKGKPYSEQYQNYFS